MECADEAVDSEPKKTQYGFNVASTAPPFAKPAAPKTPDKSVLPLRTSSRNQSLDGGLRSGWRWLDSRSFLRRKSGLRTSDSQDSSNLSASSHLKHRDSGQSDKEVGQKTGFGDRKSTADSSKWALGADWQEDAEQSPLSTLQDANRFRGFKDDCEAGSFTLGNLSQAFQANGRIEVVGTLHSSEGVRRLVKSVIGGLRAWQQPEASAEGLGGTYFFMNEFGEKQAIVKPCDEEPLAPNNPKGFVGRELGEPGLKPTVRVGEAAMREVAAFLLDHHRFANVPATALVRVTHNCFHVASDIQSQASDPSSDAMLGTSQASSSSRLSNLMATTVMPMPARRPPVKLASMQHFVKHQGDCSEMGPSRFSSSDVHKIGILDLRLFNTDRHSGNMLVNQTEDKTASHPWLARRVELIPIDHGFCLPEALEPPYFEWMHWPQAKVPFDEEELQYIAELDANADSLFLQQELPWIPEGSLHILQVATMLLKECAAAGFNLFEIASVVSRPIVGMEEEPSELEKVCVLARQKADFEMETIAESDGEDSVSEMDVLDALDGSPAGKRGVIMGHEMLINTQLSGDEMMFSLDEDPSEGQDVNGQQEPIASRSSAMAAPILNPQSSPLSIRLSEKRSEDIPPDLAKSLFAGLFPKADAGVRHRRIRAGLASHGKRNRLTSQKARNFVPPVMTGNLEAVTTVLNGLDKAGWIIFLQSLQECIQDALEEGLWKQESDNSKQNVGFGVSCPRF